MPESPPASAQPEYPQVYPGYQPYVPPAWPDHIWPTDQASASRPALVSAAIAALLVAIAWPGTVAGLGYPIMGLGVLTAAQIARTRRPTPFEAAAMVATLALLVVPSVRSAGWLDGLCLLLAWVTGTLSFAGGRSWIGLGIGSTAIAFAPLRAGRWAGRGIRRRAEGVTSVGRIAVVASVSAVLLTLFANLFAHADAVYASMLRAVLPANLLGRLAIFAAAGFLLLCLGYLANRPPAFDELTAGPSRSLRRWEWAAPLALLDVLFASFVLVELAALFGGRNHVLATSGLTYAQYARQGFWQLLAVTVLTLLVVAGCVRLAPREGPNDRLWLRLLLGLLALLTLVIVASALHRMSLYERQYGFTRLRVFVTATELWLGLVFVLVIVAGVRLRGRWLPRAVLAGLVGTVLGLAVINPDALIAQRNLDRFQQTGRIDLNYLSQLSPDAVPALQRLPTHQRECALVLLTGQVGTHRSWAAQSLGLRQAQTSLNNHPAGRCQP